MPTYVYKCPKCKHVWEEFRQIAFRDSCPCPKGCVEPNGELPPFLVCGEIQIQAIPSIFKGMGFPSNDLRKNESDPVAKLQNEVYREQYEKPE